MCTPPTVQVPWTIESKRIHREELFPTDGFYGKEGKCVGTHRGPSLSQYIRLLLTPLIWEM